MNARGYSEKDFQPASFRGIPFVAQVIEHGGGRRNVEHEVVDGKGAMEDTGKLLRSYTIRAAVAGEDYLARSELLEAALDAGMAGALVHPWFGSLSVVVGTWKASLGGKLGAIEYNIECCESGQPDTFYAVSIPDTRSWSDRLRDQLETKFTGSWGVVGTSLEMAGDAVAEVTQGAAAVLDAVQRYADPSKVGDVLQAVENLSSQAEAFVRTPGNLVEAWKAMIDPLVRAGTKGCNAAIQAIPQATPTATDSTTETNRIVLQQFERGMLAAAACRAIVDEMASGVVATWDDAVALLATTTDLARQVAEESDDPTIYRSGMDLLAQTDRIVREVAVALPHLRTWSTPRAMSVLELCQRVYADADPAMVDEVLARNGIECPAWVDGDLRLVVTA